MNLLFIPKTDSPSLELFWLLSFRGRDTKLDGFGSQINCQKGQKSGLQSQFSMSKMMQIFPKKNFIENYQFRYIFFDSFNFRNTLFFKIMPNF